MQVEHGKIKLARRAVSREREATGFTWLSIQRGDDGASRRGEFFAGADET